MPLVALVLFDLVVTELVEGLDDARMGSVPARSCWCRLAMNPLRVRHAAKSAIGDRIFALSTRPRARRGDYDRTCAFRARVWSRHPWVVAYVKIEASASERALERARFTREGAALRARSVVDAGVATMVFGQCSLGQLRPGTCRAPGGSVRRSE